MWLALHHQGLTFIDAHYQVATNLVEAMICLGQGGLRSLSALSSFMYYAQSYFCSSLSLSLIKMSVTDEKIVLSHLQGCMFNLSSTISQKTILT